MVHGSHTRVAIRELSAAATWASSPLLHLRRAYSSAHTGLLPFHMSSSGRRGVLYPIGCALVLWQELTALNTAAHSVRTSIPMAGDCRTQRIPSGTTCTTWHPVETRQWHRLSSFVVCCGVNAARGSCALHEKNTKTPKLELGARAQRGGGGGCARAFAVHKVQHPGPWGPAGLSPCGPMPAPCGPMPALCKPSNAAPY
jgi:hypothetical protein